MKLQKKLLLICAVLCLIAGGLWLFHDDGRWTPADRQRLIDTCMYNGRQLGVLFPKQTKDYCSCSTDHIIKTMTKAAYEKDLEKPVAKRAKSEYPILEGCIINFKKSVDTIR